MSMKHIYNNANIPIAGLIALSKADDDGLVIEDGEMTVSELFELLESRSANRAKRSMRRRGSSGDSLCKQVSL